MAKTKISLVIIGSLILLVIGALISYFILVFTNNIQTAKTAIEITIKDSSKVYDGTPLYASEYEVTNGTLLKGHSIDINYYGEITDAGVGESNCFLKIVSEDGRDYTNDYNVTVKKGKLEVYRRLLELEPKAKASSIDYDDDLTDDITYNIKSKLGLCKGHMIVPNFSYSEVVEDKNTNLNEVGDNPLKTTFSLTADIYDITGANVTDNYDIRYSTNSEITINKPLLTFKALSYEKQYNGEAYSPDVNSIELINGNLPSSYYVDHANFVESSFINVSDSGSLKISDVTINNAFGEDVTNNFKFYFADGFVTINPIELRVEVSSVNAIYDGKEKSDSSFKLLDYVEDDNNFEENHGFTVGNVIYYISATSPDSSKLTDVGTITNNLNFVVKTEDGETKTDNFKITYINSPVISISKKNLVIYGSNVTVEKPEEDTDIDIQNFIQEALCFDNDGSLIELSNYGLCENDSINDYKYMIPADTKLDPGTIQYQIDSGEVKIINSDGDPVTNNYEIIIFPGSLTIEGESSDPSEDVVDKNIVTIKEDLVIIPSFKSSYEERSEWIKNNTTLLYSIEEDEIPSQYYEFIIDHDENNEFAKLQFINNEGTEYTEENYYIDNATVRIKYEIKVTFNTLYYGKKYDDLSEVYNASNNYSIKFTEYFRINGTMPIGTYDPNNYVEPINDPKYCYYFENNIVIEKDKLTVIWNSISHGTEISGSGIETTIDDCQIIKKSDGTDITNDSQSQITVEIVGTAFKLPSGDYVAGTTIPYCNYIRIFNKNNDDITNYYDIEYIAGAFYITVD